MFQLWRPITFRDRLKDRAQKRVQQQVNSYHTNPSGGWTCPSRPHGMNNEVYPASLPVQGTVAFCVNCGCPSRPIIVICGEKQVLTTLEAPAPNCTETLTSIYLLLLAEQKSRPELTLAQLKEELCRNTKYTIAARPLPHFAREDETKLTPIQKVKTTSPVPVAINIDGVDKKFDAIVVLEGHFPQGLYLGRQELPCYNIGVQDAQGKLE